MFIEELRKEMASSVLKQTENGAIGHSSTGKALLDMNFKVSSYRNLSENEIISDFRRAFAQDPLMALRFLFYARDVRGGLGERRLFRVIIKEIANDSPHMSENFSLSLLNLADGMMFLHCLELLLKNLQLEKLLLN